MPIQHDEGAAELERQYELQRMKAVERDNEAARRHEEAKLKLQLQLKQKGRLSVTRTEAAERVLLALVKAWTIPFVLLLIQPYLKRGLEVPAFLTDYINL